MGIARQEGDFYFVWYYYIILKEGFAMKNEKDDSYKQEFIKKYLQCQNSIPEAKIDEFKDYVEEGCVKEWAL